MFRVSNDVVWHPNEEVISGSGSVLNHRDAGIPCLVEWGGQ